MGALDPYWAGYDAVLANVRALRPQTFPELQTILAEFHAPSSGDAFFPSNSADEELWEALEDAGWRVEFREGNYVYQAFNAAGVYVFEFFEGDLYDRSGDPRCSECEKWIDPDAVGAEAGAHGMCGSCLHNAVRSGWEPS